MWRTNLTISIPEVDTFESIGGRERRNLVLVSNAPIRTRSHISPDTDLFLFQLSPSNFHNSETFSLTTTSLSIDGVATIDPPTGNHKYHRNCEKNAHFQPPATFWWKAVGGIRGCAVIDTSTLNWCTTNQLSQMLRDLFTNFQWINSAGTGRNGVPQPVSGFPLPETAVPPPKVVVPPPGDTVLYFLFS